MSSISKSTPFGIVTVMDVNAYSMDTVVGTSSIAALYESASDIKTVNTALKGFYDTDSSAGATAALCSIDHLQVANLTTDGPNLTINGGKYNNTLLKYGKTARCEITDALAQLDALVALGGADWVNDSAHPEDGIAITDKFGSEVCLIGKTFVVDQKTGKHIPMHLVMYKFLPDSTPAFAFDSGNAATFDLNGDLLAIDVADANATACLASSGYFFSLIPSNCDLG